MVYLIGLNRGCVGGVRGGFGTSHPAPFLRSLFVGSHHIAGTVPPWLQTL